MVILYGMLAMLMNSDRSFEKNCLASVVVTGSRRDVSAMGDCIYPGLGHGYIPGGAMTYLLWLSVERSPVDIVSRSGPLQVLTIATVSVVRGVR